MTHQTQPILQVTPEFLDKNKGRAMHVFKGIFEKNFIEQVLIQTRGNQTKASEFLGISRGTLRKKIQLHKIG